jgi:hypothetical protein
VVGWDSHGQSRGGARRPLHHLRCHVGGARSARVVAALRRWLDAVSGSAASALVSGWPCLDDDDVQVLPHCRRGRGPWPWPWTWPSASPSQSASQSPTSSSTLTPRTSVVSSITVHPRPRRRCSLGLPVTTTSSRLVRQAIAPSHDLRALWCPVWSAGGRRLGRFNSEVKSLLSENPRGLVSRCVGWAALS